ncbi:MAG TPA: hypothetical protein VF486_24890 [Actinomycetes bacterium]
MTTPEPRLFAPPSTSLRPRGDGSTGPATLARDPSIRAALAGALERLNRGAGSSQRVARLLIVEEPPSLDAGEITDKGYVNQRATLQRRQDLVERLFAEPPHPDVIVH